MSLVDRLGDLLKQVTERNAPAAEVDAAYDQVAGALPKEALADGLSHAFRSEQTPPFEHMVSGLFENSTPDQKAGFVNHLLGVLGPAGFADALRSAGIGTGGQLSPESVQVLARQAAAKEPSIIDQAASFYAQHPTLVKTLGAGALALLMSRISTSRRSW